MNHGHGITDPGHSHTIYIKGRGTNANTGNEYALHPNDSPMSNLGYSSSNTTGISVNNYNGNTGDAGGTETRPVNYTIKIWKRIN